MMQIFSIAEGILFLLFGVFEFCRAFTIEESLPEVPPYYEGRITKINRKSITVRYAFEYQETEHEFPKNMLPSYKFSMKPGMKVRIFQDTRFKEPLIVSIGERNLKKSSIWLGILCLFVSLLFFTGQWEQVLT